MYVLPLEKNFFSPAPQMPYTNSISFLFCQKTNNFHHASTEIMSNQEKYFKCSINYVIADSKNPGAVNWNGRQKAEHLLIHTTDSIIYIAISVGFSDINYFSKYFKNT